MTSTILGIDPGYGITGYGVIRTTGKSTDVQLIEAGVLRTQSGKPLPQRLLELYKSFCEILEEFSPAALALEEIFSVKSFPKSAIYIGNVHGVVQLAAAEMSIPVYKYYPIQTKKALLGHGRATKVQMQKMVQRVLNLEKTPQPDDVADAIAVALCHANRNRFQ